MPTAQLFVGAVVQRARHILLVRQSAGHPLQGRWTVPWGAVESGESPANAVVRETLEEAGILCRVSGLLGVQELPEPQQGCVSLVYLCEHLRGTPTPDRKETDAARYFALGELDALAEPIEPWSEWLVRRVFAGNYKSIGADPSNPLQVHGAFL